HAALPREKRRRYGGGARRKATLATPSRPPILACVRRSGHRFADKDTRKCAKRSSRRSAPMQTKQYPVTHTDAEWHKLLTPEQYEVLRGHGTEAPGSCALNYETRAGAFSCVGCAQVLFRSKRKFDSGTGWPSFNDP